MMHKDPVASVKKSRETVHLWLSVAILVSLVIYRIATQLAYPLRERIESHMHLPVYQWLINALFFWLLILLWLAYRRWRDAIFRQQKLESVISAISPDVLMVVNADRTVTMCNHAVKRMFGYDREEVVGSKSDLLYTDRRLTGEKHEIFTYLERVGFHVGTATGKRKDGSTLPIELITGNIRGQEGVVILIRDITKRQKAEDALRLSEERFSLFMQRVPACAFIRSPAGEIIYTNECCREALGAGLEKMLESDKAAEPGNQMRCAEADDRFVAESGENVHRIHEIPGDGSSRVYDIFKFPIPTNDETPLVGGIAVDITERLAAAEERRRLEVQMLQSQKLESLGLLGGGIAHDFNNLLAGILGYADLATAEVAPDSAVARYLEEVIRASKRAADLCNQLLAYSGQGRFIVTVVDLARMIQDMEHLLRVSVSKKAVLKLDLDFDLPGVECDATQLRQVVMNLAINASDSLNNQPGTICISTHTNGCNRDMLESTFLGEKLPEGEYVSLEITDDGCGMDAKTLQRIFDPFFSTKFTGRGLGLAAVMGIVRGHGGAIRVKSEPNSGTIFQVLLPAAARPADIELTGLSSADMWTSDGQILVVDDEPVVRDIAGNMLRRMGFSVTTAETGSEAVNILKQHSDRFRAVLLDMTMPALSGVETYEQIRNADIFTPVIFSSGYNKEEELDARHMAGAVFLQKPYEMETLRRTLRDLLEGPPSDARKPKTAA